MSRHALPRRSARDVVAGGRAAGRPTAAPSPRHADSTHAVATHAVPTHAIPVPPRPHRESPLSASQLSGRPPRRTPTRKPALLLSAAVAGALVAALPIGAAAEPTPVTSTVVAETYDVTMLGVRDNVPADAGNGEVAARKELTAADAEARLEVLRADRAQRASRAAEARAEAVRPKFVLPTRGRLSSCFCQRWGTMHWGIDIAAPMFTPILAVADAVVITAGPASGYGNLVELQHEDGTVSIYGHMETIEVTAGDIVSAGDLIAKVGSRGFSTGPHLHLEIYPDGPTGNRVDPQKWLADRGIAV